MLPQDEDGSVGQVTYWSQLRTESNSVLWNSVQAILNNLEQIIPTEGDIQTICRVNNLYGENAWETMLLNLMPNGVRVGPDTELVLPESALELARELNELIAEYDTERCETMDWMFFDCKELSELKADQELFQSDNLVNVSGMFKNSSISISDINQIGWPKEDVEHEDFMEGSGWESKFKPVDD